MKVQTRLLLHLFIFGLFTRVHAVLGGSLSLSPLEINAVADLTVTIQLGSGSLGNGDYFVLANIAPGKFAADSLCTLIQPSTSKVVISGCVLTQTSVKVTFQVISGNTAFLLLKISKFTNPPSATSISVNVSRFSNSNMLLEQGSFQITGLISLPLSNALISPLSQQIGQLFSQIQFTVKLANDLPANGQVWLKVPYYNPLSSQKENIFSSNNPSCKQVIGASQIAVTCIFDSSLNILKLTNLATSLAGTTLIFQSDSFKNPYDGKSRTGYSISTTDQTGAEINYSSVALSIQVSTAASFQFAYFSVNNPQMGQYSDLTLNYRINLPSDPSCRLKIGFPSQLDIKTTFISAAGLSQFKNTVVQIDAATNTLILSGCPSYVDMNSNGDSLTISRIKVPASKRNSDPFKLSVFAYDNGIEYLIASDLGTVLEAGDIQGGVISQPLIQAVQSSTVGATTSVKIQFQLNNEIPASNQITIQFPTTVASFKLADNTSCVLEAPLQNASTPKTCTIVNNLITIVNINGSSMVQAGSTITFTLSGMKNPDLVQDVGSFVFSSFEVFNGQTYSIDALTQSDLYKPTPAQIVSGLSVVPSSFFTNNQPTCMTVKFISPVKIIQDSIIVVTLPSEISIANQTNIKSECYITVGSRPSQRINLLTFSASAGQTLITIKDGFSTDNFDPVIDPTPIQLQLCQLINPQTLKQSSSFQISIQDKTQLPYAQGTQGLTATMTDFGQLLSVTVTPDSLVNGSTTSYTIQVTPNYSMKSNSVFKITFPPQVTLSSSSKCTPSTNLSSVQCLVATQNLEATLTFNSGSISSGIAFSFKVSNLKNPGLTKPTDVFSEMKTFDESGYQISKFTSQGVNTGTSLPGDMGKGILVQSNNDPAQQSTYTLTLNSLNGFSSGASILVKYPTLVTAGTISTCQVSLGTNSSTATCAVNQLSKTIQVTGINSNLAPGQQFSIAFGMLQNPSKVTTESFVVSVYSDSSMTYIIDQSSSGMIPGVQCALPCKACVSSSQPSSCTLCYQDGTTSLPYLSGSTCVASCPSGMFADGSKQCLACYSHCQSCSSINTCLSCDPQGSWPIFSNSQCIDICPDGTYKDSKNTCQPCQSPCLNCFGMANGQCNSCIQLAGAAMYLNGNSCIANCPDGYLGADQRCMQCQGNCLTCSVTTTSCTSCKGQNFLLGTACAATCPKGYVANYSTMKCEGCDPKCEVCSGSTASIQVCTRCQPSFYLSQGACFSACPSGYEADLNTVCVLKPPLVVEPVIVPKNITIESNLTATNQTLATGIENSCRQLGFKFGFLLYFPFIVLSVVVLLIVLGSYCYDKDTRLTAASVAFLAPVEALALFAQCFFAYQTEGIKGLYCNKSNGDQLHVYPFVFFGTSIIIALLYVLNFIYFIQVSCCNSKLRRDQNFKAWKQKHCCAFTTVLISSTLLSFKLGSIIYSFFLGRKQYLAEFEQQKPYFRITHNLNISFIILGNTPLILLDIGALTFYKWGSQFYIILIETLVISVAMVLLQVFDFRHAKKLIKIEEDLKGVKFDSDEEAKQAQDVIQFDSDRKGRDNSLSGIGLLKRAGESEHTEDELNQSTQRRRRGVLGSGLDDDYSPNKLASITSEDENSSGSGHVRRIRACSHNETSPTRTKLMEMDPSLPDGLRSGNQSQVKAPIYPEQRNFNENDILGEVNRDALNRPIPIFSPSTGNYVDNNGRQVNQKGYLIDHNGDIVNHLGELVFEKEEMQLNGELPLSFAIERYNFNPFDILGYVVNSDKLLSGKDFNGRAMNKFGFLVDEEGNIINRRNRKIIDKGHLDDQGDFPKLFSYNAVSFHIKDVLGELHRDKTTGDAVHKRDICGGRYWDKLGREVNQRGYLVDKDGNVINQAGEILFYKHQLNEDGDIPKIFSFTYFNQSDVMGKYQIDPQTDLPVISEDSELAEGQYRDDEGAAVNRLGFLVQPEGHICDKGKRKVFDYEILEDNHTNIPLVFRKGMALKNQSESVLLPSLQNFETDKSGVTMFDQVKPSGMEKTGGKDKVDGMENERLFNVNDIQGDLDLDAEFKPILEHRSNTGELIDKQGRPVSVKGYLIDTEGNILNQEGQQVFKKEDLRKGIELPVLQGLEKFNFNPLDILGNIEEAALVQLKPNNKGVFCDKNGKKISKFGFLINKSGDVINRKKKRILRKQYLKPNGDFPSLLNYQGLIFDIKDILGEMIRDSKTGEAVLKKDLKSGRYFDKNGKEINKRGYLVDRNGNVINKKGKKIFDKFELNKHGDIPKLFQFTQFDEEAIKGHYCLDTDGMPILEGSSSLPKGVFYDDQGDTVNKLGFLVDLAGNVLDEKGNVVFAKSLLTDGYKNIPSVFIPNSKPAAGTATVTIIPKNFNQQKAIILKRLSLEMVVEEKVSPKKQATINSEGVFSPIGSGSVKLNSMLNGKIDGFDYQQEESKTEELDMMIATLGEMEDEEDSFEYGDESNNANGVKIKTGKQKLKSKKKKVKKQKQNPALIAIKAANDNKLARIYKNDITASVTSSQKSFRSTVNSSRRQTANIKGFPKFTAHSPRDQKSLTGVDFTNGGKTKSGSMLASEDKPDKETLKYLNEMIEGDDFREEAKVPINIVFEAIQQSQNRNENYRRRPRLGDNISSLQVPNTPSIEERKLHTKQSIRSIKSKSSVRPNIDRLNSVATSYLQPLPTKQHRNASMNKTSTSGFHPQRTAFGGFAGVGKLVTSKNSSRDNSGGPRETWNMVYTEPSIVAETHRTRELVTERLKENFLNNNDFGRLDQVKRQDSLEKKHRDKHFYGPNTVRVNHDIEFEAQMKRERDKDLRMRDVLTGQNSVNPQNQQSRSMLEDHKPSKTALLSPNSMSPRDQKPPLASTKVSNFKQTSKPDKNTSRSLQPSSHY